MLIYEVYLTIGTSQYGIGKDRMSLSSLPEEVLVRINYLANELLYCEYQLYRKIRSATTSVTINFLHHPSQLSIYPRVKRVKVLSVDLVNYKLSDYLPPSANVLEIANKVPTKSLLNSIPVHVTDVTIGVMDVVHASDLFHHQLSQVASSLVTVFEAGSPADVHEGVTRLVTRNLTYNDEWKNVQVLHDQQGILHSLSEKVTDVLCLQLGTSHRYLRSIVALSVTCPSLVRDDALLLASLPPLLETLMIEYISRVNTEGVEKLPSTLRRLHLPNVDVKPPFSSLIAKSEVRSLWIYLCHPSVYRDMKLEELYMDEGRYAEPIFYPSTLKKLKVSGNEIRVLPSGLEWLWIVQGEELVTQTLPSSLEVLVTSAQNWSSVFQKQDLPVLKRLTLTGRCSKIGREDFPPSLTSLEVTKDHPENINGLPPSLQHLAVNHFKDCGDLPNLKSLFCITPSDPFPVSLTDLRVHGAQSGMMNQEDILSLPPRLTHLSIRGMDEEDLLLLPLSLGSLRLTEEDYPPGEEGHPALHCNDK